MIDIHILRSDGSMIFKHGNLQSFHRELSYDIILKINA